ncbi:hypothetical protein O3V59_16490 [Brevibacillus thermoruber]|uniref:Uncharacterized protein n=1 Tax=Brevibacillus thermoruber TaxID=33942 RepID=A0A9X3Z4H5_9BACL|nr:hypothetical protein [Brevibacillus thermoruber]MDA5109966.1 hypothetical protein [Brevibacillus thermoruber]
MCREGRHEANAARRGVGEYRFEPRSADIKAIRIHQERYGESFSFTVPLAKGGTP